jgi:hypothetical protein
MKQKRYFWLATPLLASVATLQAADVNVTTDITTNTTWTASNTYILDKSIFVKNGATLTIEPGTTILGTQNVPNNTYGSLVITRNGKIHAEGTAEQPIVMTAKEERDTNLTPAPEDDLDPAAGDGGFWGGLIILGNAPINYYTGPTTNANENSIEGFPAGSSSDILYGGTNSSDNSGVVKFVSIRFGGYVYTSGREINGLTMGGVGSGTTIEDVEVVSNTDDGVEIFGGTVNTKRIAVAFCQDDSFDLDEGHQGNHQFWFAIQNATGSLGDRGGEWDGGNVPNPNSGGGVVTGTPFTTATIYNATFIGDSGSAGGGNHAFFVDDNFAGQLHNSAVHQFSGQAVVDSGDGIGAAPNPLFQNTTFGTIAGGAGALASVSGTGVSALGTDPLLGGISRIANGGLDPRPNATSPLYSGTLSSAANGFLTPTNYRGAFGTTNWLAGWSYLSKKGYFGNLATLPSTGSAPFADADGDGISDTLEATSALTALGFSAGVNNVSPTNLFNSIYTTSSILDLVAPNQVMVQKSGGNVTLSLPLFRSTTLQSFTPAPALQATFPATEPAEFYRIEVPNAQ